jgi:hypothetical protein
MYETARTTGWAAIAFAIVYVGTFVSNMVLMILGPASGVRYKTPDQMIADRLAGDVGAIGFALLGATLIVVAMGLRRLIWADESIVGTAASSVGVIAGAGLMLTGAAVGAARGFAANDLAATGADIAMQRAVVQGGSLLVNAAFFLASIALLIWLSSVAVAARRERALSGQLVAATWVAAIGPFASLALTSFPILLLVTIPWAAALGISLVRRSRRLAATAAGAIAPAASLA